MGEDLKSLYADASKAHDEVHRWAFGDDSVIADRHGVLLRVEVVRDALEAFRRSPAPEQVSTVEELDALPVGSVVMSRLAGGGTFAAVRMVGHWFITGHRGYYTAEGVEHKFGFPLSVLFRPEEGESA